MIKAIFYPNSIPVVFPSDEYFIPYLATTMQSIMENSDKKKKYAFFVLHGDISQPTMDKLKKQISFFPQFTIDFINVSHFLEGYNLFVSGHITIETYYRLLIPELFVDYKKVIYHDSDMICRVDISELYGIDLGENLLAASRDILGICRYYMYFKNKKLIGTDQISLQDADNYFNAGLLLINIIQFRSAFILKDLLNFALSKEWRSYDQDVLNVLCKGRVLFLPLSYNFNKDDNAAIYLPEKIKKEYLETIKNPKIIHFMGPSKKPWNNTTYVPYFELFWKYANATPFIDTIVSRMYEKKLVLSISLADTIISNIKHRGGIGLLFILRCFKAWISRDKKHKENHA
jgi:lipopolysaccharide biosynthesis glycosyltransferase